MALPARGRRRRRRRTQLGQHVAGSDSAALFTRRTFATLSTRARRRCTRSLVAVSLPPLHRRGATTGALNILQIGRPVAAHYRYEGGRLAVAPATQASPALMMTQIRSLGTSKKSDAAAAAAAAAAAGSHAIRTAKLAGSLVLPF
jgi:hypothetical protein